MSLKRNTANGQSPGTTLSTGNSGGASGDAFSGVVASGGSTITFDSTHQHSHSNSYSIIGSTSGQAAHVELTLVETGFFYTQFQTYVYLSSYPASTSPFVSIGGVETFSISTAGALSGASVFGSSSFSSPSATLPLNTFLRIDAVVGVDDSVPTDGPLYVQVSLGDSVTPAWTYAGATDHGTNTINYARVGVLDSTKPIPQFWVDDFAIANNHPSNFLAPFSVPLVVPLGFLGQV